MSMQPGYDTAPEPQDQNLVYHPETGEAFRYAKYVATDGITYEGWGGYGPDGRFTVVPPDHPLPLIGDVNQPHEYVQGSVVESTAVDTLSAGQPELALPLQANGPLLKYRWNQGWGEASKSFISSDKEARGRIGKLVIGTIMRNKKMMVVATKFSPVLVPTALAIPTPEELIYYPVIIATAVAVHRERKRLNEQRT